jgi:succinoglycan biosynthesis transport protein ExoP
MASIDNSQAFDDAFQRTTRPTQPEIADILGIARRGWLFVAGGIAFGLACALFVLSTMPPTYKASSRIVFERTTSRYLQTNKVTNEPIIEDYDTMGQTYVIPSEANLLKVVSSLSLASDPDFVGAKNSETLGSRVRGLLQEAAQAVGFAKEPVEHQSVDPEKIAVDTLVRNLTVSREDVANVITVAFTWKDPVKAATIVNAVVDTYFDASVASKIKSTGLAGKVVQERVEEVKQQAKDAERALLEFKAANKLVGSDQLTLSHGQLSILQTQLTNAQLAMADARSRIDRFARAPDASALIAPDNELITKLRGELMDLSVRANDIEKLVGKNHLAVVKIRDRMEEIRQTIAVEQKRIAGSYQKEYDLARSRYDELAGSISQVVSSEGANSNVLARLRELERSADTLRNLYSRTLEQGSDLNRVEAQPAVAPDARVLNRADPPLQTEASKKRILILAGGSMLGLLLGGAIVFGRTSPFGVFRTTQQVTHATGLSCSVLPQIVNTNEQESLRIGEFVLNWPYSRYAQGLRSIWATINIAQRESAVKVIGVLSSNPGEGKTTVAINLAAHFGRHSTTRVLLIDADFYRQSLTKSIASDATVGLREALAEPAALSKFVVKKERLNLDVLPCPVQNDLPNPTELLGTSEMEHLIKVAREAYDLVIIESPPMAAIVDYKMIARHCNGFVMVVEWGKTSQRLVLECLSDASELLDRVLCVILNKADPSALRSIEHYKGDRFHAYYRDQKSA